MILSYCDLLGDGKRHRIKASTTTDHCASHYGQPVIVLEDGDVLDLASWALLGYQVERASARERADLEKIFGLLRRMFGETELINVTQAAREKGVSRAAVYYALASGKITGERIAGTVMVVRNAAFEAWQPKQ